MNYDLSLTPTPELFIELEKRHLAMVFMGIPYSSHNNPATGDSKVVRDLKGDPLILIGLCEMMKQATVIRAIGTARFDKDLQD